VIYRSTNIRGAFRQRQRGFIINPFRFGGGGGGGDPYWDDVAELMPFNGPNSSTTFTSQKGRSWTRTGSGTISTARSKFGGASLLLPGSSYLTSTDNMAALAIGTGKVTVEAWVYIPSGAGTGSFWVYSQAQSTGSSDASAGFGICARHNSFSNMARVFDYATGVGYNSSSALPLDEWVFLQFTRDESGNIKLYANEDEIISASGVTSNWGTPTRARIGATPQLSSGFLVTPEMNIDDLRITVGVARENEVPIGAFPNY